MAFEGAFVTLVGLIKLELPGRTVRLSDGGFCDFGGERYTARDDVLGAIGAVAPVVEGIGDLAPGGEIEFLPAPDADPGLLNSPTNQNSRLRGWLAEIGGDGKTVTHAEPLFDGLVDVPTLKLARGAYSLALTFMSRAEKLFAINRGNTLSPRFHKSVWPGELGFDNCTDAQISVAWGTGAPTRGSGYAGVGLVGFAASAFDINSRLQGNAGTT